MFTLIPPRAAEKQLVSFAQSAGPVSGSFALFPLPVWLNRAPEGSGEPSSRPFFSPASGAKIAVRDNEKRRRMLRRSPFHSRAHPRAIPSRVACSHSIPARRFLISLPPAAPSVFPRAPPPPSQSRRDRAPFEIVSRSVARRGVKRRAPAERGDRLAPKLEIAEITFIWRARGGDSQSARHNPKI